MELTPTISNDHSNNISSKAPKFPSWSSSAEGIISNLDILIEILQRLPVRSLIRLKLVSKQWHDLILETRFSSKHISRNLKPSISGLYYTQDTYPIPLQGHTLPMFPSMGAPNCTIHASQNGLILCSYVLSCGRSQIMVCNPTTQRYKVVAKMQLDVDEYIANSHFYLYFDPSISSSYKLILIREKQLQYKIAIFASDSSISKTLCLKGQVQFGYCLVHGVLSSDGSIYMITKNWYLLQIDIEKEKLSAARMTQEPQMPRSRVVGYFGERACGDLVLVVMNQSVLDFLVYEMKKLLGGRHWIFKHHIDLTQQLNNFPGMRQPINRSNFTVMRLFWEGEEDERGLNLVLGLPGRAIMYNHNSKEIKVISSLPADDFLNWQSTYRRVHPFIGSLCEV